MKVAIYDKDIVSAAELALTLQRTLRDVEVTYCEAVNDPELRSSNIVVADPSPEITSDWIINFRRHNGSVPLVLVSGNTDLLNGSLADKCFAVTKPYSIKDLLEAIVIAGSGKPYGQGLIPARRWQ